MFRQPVPSTYSARDERVIEELVRSKVAGGGMVWGSECD